VTDEVTSNDDRTRRFVRQRFKNMKKMGIGTTIMWTGCMEVKSKIQSVSQV